MMLWMIRVLIIMVAIMRTTKTENQLWGQKKGSVNTHTLKASRATTWQSKYKEHAKNFPSGVAKKQKKITTKPNIAEKYKQKIQRILACHTVARAKHLQPQPKDPVEVFVQTIILRRMMKHIRDEKVIHPTLVKMTMVILTLMIKLILIRPCK